MDNVLQAIHPQLTPRLAQSVIAFCLCEQLPVHDCFSQLIREGSRAKNHCIPD